MVASGGTGNRTTMRRSRLQLCWGICWKARQQWRLGRGWRSRAAGGGLVRRCDVPHHVDLAYCHGRGDGGRQKLRD
jgi:hypothetical protein